MIDRRSVLFGIPFGTLTIIGGQTNAGVSIISQVHELMRGVRSRWRGLAPYGLIMRDLHEGMGKLAVDGKISGFTAEINKIVAQPVFTPDGRPAPMQHELRVRFRLRGSDMNHAYRLIL